MGIEDEILQHEATLAEIDKKIKDNKTKLESMRQRKRELEDEIEGLRA